MKTEFQEAITIFLKSPIADVKCAEMPDGLKIIAFKAMLGVEITDEQRELLSHFALLRQVELVRNMTTLLDVKSCLDPSEHDQIPTQAAMLEFVASKITAEIDSVLPPLKVRAANIYVNTYKYSNRAIEHGNVAVITRPPQAMENPSVPSNTAAPYSEENAVRLSPEELSGIYLPDRDNAKSTNFGVTGDFNILVMAAVVQRYMAIRKIQHFMAAYKLGFLKDSDLGPLSFSIKYQLNSNGEIDIENTLLKQWKEQIHPTFGRLFCLSTFHAVVFHGYLTFAQWLWQFATPAQQEDGLKISFERAVGQNHLAFAQWLCRIATPEQRSAMFEDEYDGAASNEGSGLALTQWKWNESNTLDYCHIFCASALNGHMVMAQWLSEISSPEDKTAMLEADGDGGDVPSAFEGAVICGHLALAQWLWGIATSAQRKAMFERENYRAIRHAAWQGRILMVKWLWQCATAEQKVTLLEPQLVRNEEDEEDDFVSIFYSAVSGGDLASARWIWQIASATQQSVLLESGHLNIFAVNLAMAQWVWQIASTTQQSVLLEKADDSLFQGYFSMAQWVWQIASSEKIAGMLISAENTLKFYTNVHDDSDPDRMNRIIASIFKITQTIERLWAELPPTKQQEVLTCLVLTFLMTAETKEISLSQINIFGQIPSLAKSALSFFSSSKETKRPLAMTEPDRPTKFQACEPEITRDSNFLVKDTPPNPPQVPLSKKREREETPNYSEDDMDLVDHLDMPEEWLAEWPHSP